MKMRDVVKRAEACLRDCGELDVGERLVLAEQRVGFAGFGECAGVCGRETEHVCLTLARGGEKKFFSACLNCGEVQEQG